MRYHWLLEDISQELYKCIRDYDVCQEVGLRYLQIKENQSIDDARKYHHDCLKTMANNIDHNNISWSYYLPFTELDKDIVSYEILCAHMNRKCEIEIYLKVIASKIGIRILGETVCTAIGVNYFKDDLILKDKIKELYDIKYHMLISCYNNIVLD